MNPVICPSGGGNAARTPSSTQSGCLIRLPAPKDPCIINDIALKAKFRHALINTTLQENSSFVVTGSRRRWLPYTASTRRTISER